MSEQKSTKFVGNALWKMLETFSAKGISMVVSLILARLIAPEEFGVLGITGIFIGLTDILLTSGFTPALIQKKEIKEHDYSTVFAISLTSAVILYTAIFFASPWLADYYNEPLVVPVMRVVALAIFFQALAAVRSAVLGRAMNFRLVFICTCFSNVISGTVGVAMAFMGFGVWALVAQQLTAAVFSTIFLYLKVKIKIRLRFSKESFREIVPFSVKILASTLLSYISDSAYSVVIGKKYSLADLSLFGKGCQFPRQFSLYTFGAISSVLLAALSRYSSDRERLKMLVRKVNVTTSYIIFPMMAGLACVAEPFVRVILTEPWLPCVGVLQWQCLYYGVTPMMLTFVQLHLAIGDGNMRIRQETIRTVLMFGSLLALVLMNSNITMLSCVQAMIAVFTTLIACVETHRSIRYTIWEQLKDILPSLLCTAAMAAATIFVGSFFESGMVKLVVQVATGAAAYVVVSIVTKNAGFHYLLDILRSRKKKTA